MSKYVKNTHVTDTQNWAGQDILAGEYFLIETIKLPRWQQNSDFIADIASGLAVMATSNDGNEDITDVNSAIDYLKDNQPIIIDSAFPLNQYALASGDSLRARLIGTHNVTATKTSTTDHDWKVPAVAYLGVNKQSVMNGLEYFAKDAEIGDSITFQIVDIDNVLGYGANTVLDEFSKTWYVIPNASNTIVLYKANLIKDLYVRIKYTSVGATNDVSLICNLFRHIDTAVNI